MKTKVYGETTLDPVLARDCLVIHAKTSQDSNGNGRRLYLVVHRLGYVAAIDEAPRGHGAIAAELGKDVADVLWCREGVSRVVGDLDVTPKCYRDLLREYGANGPQRRRIEARSPVESKLGDLP